MLVNHFINIKTVFFNWLKLLKQSVITINDSTGEDRHLTFQTLNSNQVKCTLGLGNLKCEKFTQPKDLYIIYGKITLAIRAGLRGEPAGQLPGELKYHWNKSEMWCQVNSGFYT
jgi:hypothetical protein